MRKTTKIWLVTAALLVLLGCIVFVTGMAVLNWDFTSLSSVKYETNKHEVSEEYKNITIKTDTAKLTLVPSEAAKTAVVCYEQENAKHSVTVKDGTLTVEKIDTKKWYEYIGINYGAEEIKVYIPEGEYGRLSVKSDTGAVEVPADFKFESITISEDTGSVTSYASAHGKVSIKTDTGSIRVENVSVGAMELSASTGRITVSDVTSEGDVEIKLSTGKTYLTDVECKNLVSKGSTGDVFLKNVIATEKLSVKRSTGDISFEGSDAAELTVKTSTGDVSGTLLTEKVFIIETDTGSVDVPKTTTGGKCEVSTDTGDIKLQIQS